MTERRLTRRETLGLARSAGLGLLGLAACQKAGAALNYRGNVLKKKPVGYWRLGETKGSIAHDETSFMRDGALHGNPRFGAKGALAGDPDTALTLDGKESYVEVADDAAFSQPTSGQGLTVEAWMRPDALVFDGDGEHYLHWLGKGEPGQYEWALRFYSKQSGRPNRISAYIWNPTGGLGSGAYVQEDLQPGEWVHIVACYLPGDLRTPRAGVLIYKNGVLRGGPETRPPQPGALYKQYNIRPAHGNAPLRFGTRDKQGFFQGALDEIAIYPRVLTAREVEENYRAGTAH